MAKLIRQTTCRPRSVPTRTAAAHPGRRRHPKISSRTERTCIRRSTTQHSKGRASRSILRLSRDFQIKNRPKVAHSRVLGRLDRLIIAKSRSRTKRAVPSGLKIRPYNRHKTQQRFDRQELPSAGNRGFARTGERMVSSFLAFFSDAILWLLHISSSFAETKTSNFQRTSSPEAFRLCRTSASSSARR